VIKLSNARIELAFVAINLQKNQVYCYSFWLLSKSSLAKYYWPLDFSTTVGLGS
jgi:hypothetical protein